MQAKKLMTADVISCRLGEPLPAIIDRMVENRIGGMPVVDDSGRLVGMLTEGDLLRMCLPKSVRFLDTDLYLENTDEFEGQYAKLRRLTAADVMSRGVICVEARDSLGQVSATLHQHDIKQVPVLEEGRMVGIISRQDIVRTLNAYLKAGPKPAEPVNSGRPFKNDIY